MATSPGDRIRRVVFQRSVEHRTCTHVAAPGDVTPSIEHGEHWAWCYADGAYLPSIDG